jgi:hypothetical protein
MTDRDKKLLSFILPAVMIAGYWFLLLAPARDQAGKLGADLAKQEQTRDKLQTQVSQLGQARSDFATDYAAVVELGKAVPASVDMPSLIVQLDKASHGTGIGFERIHAGERLPADSPSSAGAGGAGTPAAGAPAAAAGGEQASTGAGKATEKANDTKAKQDAAAGAPAAGAPPAGAPAAGTPAGAAATTATSGVPGLDAVPLEFTFRGSFFDLADFFHRMKRFVHVVDDRVAVRGRLMTIEGVDFKTTNFPRLEAQVTAKVYLAPKKQGTTAGADPNGPAPGPGGGSQEASSPTPSGGGTPAATVAR